MSYTSLIVCSAGLILQIFLNILYVHVYTFYVVDYSSAGLMFFHAALIAGAAKLISAEFLSFMYVTIGG